MSVSTVTVDELHQHQPHAGGSVAVAVASIPSERGGGGGDGGIEKSGRFDRHSSETEGPSRARPAMAGVIGTSGSNTIHKPTLAERSRMQQHMARQQKVEAPHDAAAERSAREGATIVHQPPWGCSSAHSAILLSVVADFNDYDLDASKHQLSDYELRKEWDDGGGHGVGHGAGRVSSTGGRVSSTGGRVSSAGGRSSGSSSGASGSMETPDCNDTDVPRSAVSSMVHI
jgi:hypothetical protein